MGLSTKLSINGPQLYAGYHLDPVPWHWRPVMPNAHYGWWARTFVLGDVMDILGAMDTNELIPRGLFFTLRLCGKK